MFHRLIPLFVIVPIAELALLIQLGRWVGLWQTLAIILLAGMLGAAIAAREGLRAWRAFLYEIEQGRIPGRPILDGLCVLAGGALLLTPGLITDLAGLLLLLRPTRRWIQDRTLNWLSGGLFGQGQVLVRTAAGWQSRAGPPPGRGEEAEGAEAAPAGGGPVGQGRGRGREREPERGREIEPPSWRPRPGG